MARSLLQHPHWQSCARTGAILCGFFGALGVTPPSLAQDTAPLPAQVEFNRDVRPILSDNCFYCHGPDANHREADLRLDIRDEALDSGAIVPEEPAESELIARIQEEDPDLRMPPPQSHKTLTDRQKALLQRWIEQGAAYQRHWAYEPPVKAEIDPGQNAVDVLVRGRLAEIGLTPSPEADRRTLIRRLYWDLIGLPPTPEEVAAFEADPSPDAYEDLVERLLQNPHFGERLALSWLDVVRFADTIGYHSDNPRNVWPYRDWVIHSFNANKPFDRFTIEQIAGDLVPDANQETRVGSAFNRLLLTTEEGGAQPKDYEARMVADRVRAIGTAWLGQTTGCAQCHDHKFDPFTMRDFYSLGAFFADIEEPIIGQREVGMAVMTPEQEQQLAQLDAARAEAARAFEAIVPQLEIAQQQWEADVVAYDVTLPELRPDSQAAEPAKQAARQVLEILKGSSRTPQQQQAVRDYFRGTATRLFVAEREAVAKAERERKEFYDSLPKCLVSVSTPTKRTVRILPRGNWMDESGEVLQPALPHYLPQPAVDGRELTRLDLAHWLVSRDNPLTARTVMNRLWQQYFGTGISKVLSDLGAQGEPPTNPALLDWLACEFMDSGWDLKHMVRTMVTSATYRQVSTATPELLAADPYNREYARQSAVRLDAELVRDTALAVSGLLEPAIGGPSVKPYQPDGYWENLNFPTRDYVPDKGESQYRRGLYVWWQRSFLHPSLLAFDAPCREECAAERARSNIPQQALVLLNDPTYVEAARVLAARVLRECTGTPEERLVRFWQLVLQRNPREQELRTMLELLDLHLSVYRGDPQAADKVLQVGLTAAPTDKDVVELAAWTHVARVLLNLHETITRS
ncbi:MAG: PSD1 and planctomycete cytochrome C domain-containing protein [Pirellulaceae bacterium]|nr:PSD1 and planctomycete cytochrome C domain-containing protein [Pirellulaceae bacterium]